MAEQLPSFQQARTDHTAESFRRLVTALSGNPTVSGIHGDGDLVVSERGAGANMSVDVADGMGFVVNDTISTGGTWHIDNQGTTNVAIAVADPTNPRYDLVVAQVYDTQSPMSDGTNEFVLRVVTGTPAGSPSIPATPDNCIALARVSVAALATSIVDGNIIDLRVQHNPKYAMQVFTASGSFTKATYPWAKAIRVRVVGGGGGSGGVAATTASQRGEAGGGGGGAYSESYRSVSDLLSSETVTIGTGGAAGASTPGAGGAGGTSSFGSHGTATGGSGGSLSTPTADNNVSNGGAGGVASAGDINLPGQRGHAGGTFASGTTITQASINAGGNAGGGMGNGAVNAGGNTTSSGTAGHLYGGGAAGSKNSNSQVARGGSLGAAGVVIVEIFG